MYFHHVADLVDPGERRDARHQVSPERGRGAQHVAIVRGQGKRFNRPVGCQRRRQVRRVHGYDLADGIQLCGLCSNGVDTVAKYGDVDLAANRLCAADNLGRAGVQCFAVVFGNDQDPAHINPLFFNSWTSWAASSTMMPFWRCGGGAK